MAGIESDLYDIMSLAIIKPAESAALLPLPLPR
jgi:hypothetical protein